MRKATRKSGQSWYMAAVYIAVSFLVSMAARAEVVYTVNNTGDAGYTTIQDAFSALPATFADNYRVEVQYSGSDYTNAALGTISAASYSLTIIGTGSQRPTIRTVGVAATSYGLDLNEVDRVSVMNFVFATTLNANNQSGGYIHDVKGNGTISGNIFKKPDRGTTGNYPGRMSAIYVANYKGQDGLIIEKNYWHSYPNSWMISDGIASYGGSPGNPMVVRNNIVEESLLCRVIGGSWGTQSRGSIYILNNTLRASGHVSWMIGLGKHPGTDYSSVVVANNIFATMGEVDGVYDLKHPAATAANAFLGHNMISDSADLIDIGRTDNSTTTYATLAAWQAVLAGGSNSWDETASFLDDPEFAELDDDDDPEDLKWAKDAPAHGTGMAAATVLPNGETLETMMGSTDYFGNPRITGAPDIGAFEYPPPSGTVIMIN